MSYIAADKFGLKIFSNKPIREKKEEYWYDVLNEDFIQIPNKCAKLFYENDLLVNCTIPLDKRDMNWGDNPIYLKEI